MCTSLVKRHWYKKEGLRFGMACSLNKPQAAIACRASGSPGCVNYALLLIL